jgi:protein-L-isoaspartate(D-aspartate) O-methyltransferase
MTWFKRPPVDPGASLPLPEEVFAGPFGPERRRMVEQQLRPRGIADPRVLAAMAKVPRHEFIDPNLVGHAYEDGPLGIGHGQTISQPYMVAKMSELARVKKTTRALEIGVGCGYQTAVLMELGARVEGIEIVEPLARKAEAILRRLNYTDFRIHVRDGYGGLPEAGPYEVILLAAAPLDVPQPLLEQLADGGRLVAPLGPIDDQRLWLIERQGDQFKRSVRFVPMTGRALDG